jgi:hypothetical protein
MCFDRCPRCSSLRYELLRTHAFCVECNFSPDLEKDADDVAIPQWAIAAVNELIEAEKASRKKKSRAPRRLSLSYGPSLALAM